MGGLFYVLQNITGTTISIRHSLYYVVIPVVYTFDTVKHN